MTILWLCALLLVGQMQMPLNEDVVRLPPHASSIPGSDGGKMVELLYASPSLSLPKQFPAHDAKGEAWFVDVKNLGPAEVAVEGPRGFSVHLQPKQVVRIRAAGPSFSASYSY